MLPACRTDPSRSLPVDVPNKRPRSQQMTVGSPVSTLDFMPSMALDMELLGPLDSEVSTRDTATARSSCSGGALSRKNKPQRCSICKECGHKSRTCKLAQSPIGALHTTPNLCVLLGVRVSACFVVASICYRDGRINVPHDAASCLEAATT